jgi:hypothetical protein
MIVFGAGASHDSLAEYPPISFQTFQQLAMPHYQNEPRRPPLAAQLFQHERFSEFFTRYPECVGLFPQLDRAAKSTGIEQRLAELVEESEGDSVVRAQLIALRFYIREVIASSVTKWRDITRGADNYAELLDRVDRWRRKTQPEQQVALVTFNYDVLLDEATSGLHYFRPPFKSMADYIGRDEYKLVKLHGSTDWLRLIPGVSHKHGSYADAIEFASRNQIPPPSGADIVTCNEAAPQGKRPVDMPAIAIPVQEKSPSSFELPREHMDVLVRCIDATTDLIVVGWRGMERHFLDLWHAKTPPEYAPSGPPHLKRVLIVDKGEGTQAVESQLRTVGLMDAQMELLADGFSAFLMGDRLETFLSGVLLMPDRARV